MKLGMDLFPEGSEVHPAGEFEAEDALAMDSWETLLCRAEFGLAGDAIASTGFHQPIPSKSGPVQPLGRALSAALLQSQRPDSDQPPRYDHLIRAGRSVPLIPDHRLACRNGQSGPAMDQQGVQRGKRATSLSRSRCKSLCG